MNFFFWAPVNVQFKWRLLWCQKKSFYLQGHCALCILWLVRSFVSFFEMIIFMLCWIMCSSNLKSQLHFIIMAGKTLLLLTSVTSFGWQRCWLHIMVVHVCWCSACLFQKWNRRKNNQKLNELKKACGHFNLNLVFCLFTFRNWDSAFRFSKQAI